MCGRREIRRDSSVRVLMQLLLLYCIVLFIVLDVWLYCVLCVAYFDELRFLSSPFSLLRCYAYSAPLLTVCVPF